MLEAVKLEDLELNPFKMIGKQWTLITSGDLESFNMMIASWGSFGILWGKPVATIYVRPSRYTKEFIDRNELLTLSYYPEKYRKALSVCGSRSGRDFDKMHQSGLTPLAVDGSVTFEEAELTFVGKRIYGDWLKAEAFTQTTEIITDCYPQLDFHEQYVVEILAAYRNK